MKIRRIEMAGFKSFADRTTLIFSEGLSGVVGSNGCGKSNVVDAVRWCLGEQSAKSMRGNAMQDVIFSGTQKRNPVNKAEVSIVFGPGDTPFKGDYALRDEIQLTRRLERDGPSQYFINQQRVRLKDVQDLFLDSGLSNQRYSFIEQGQIGDIVNARPSETRQLIEEAAGISRYQQRRADALARLEDVDSNLTQLQRIIQEHDRRLKSVAKQVRNAWLNRCYASKIVQLSCLIELTEYSHLVSLRRVQGAAFREAEQGEQRISRKLDQQVAVLYQARNSESTLQNTVNTLRSNLGDLESDRREKQALVDSADQEMARIQALRVEHDGRMAKTRTEINDNRRDVEAVKQEYDTSSQTLLELRQLLKAAVEVHNESTQRIREIDSQVQQHSADEQKTIRSIQAQDGQIQAAQLKIQQLTREQEELSLQSGDVEHDIQQLEQQRQQQIEAVESLKTQVENQNQAYQAAVNAYQEHQKSIEAERRVLAQQERHYQKEVRNLSALKGELDGVLRIHKRYEGLSGAAKALLNHPRSKGVLAEMIRLPEEGSDWAAVVLAGFLEAVVCDSLRDAQELIAQSKGQVIVIALEGLQECSHPSLQKLAKNEMGARALNAILPEYQEAEWLTEVRSQTTWVRSCQALVRSGSIVRSGQQSDPALEFMARARRIEELQQTMGTAEAERARLEQQLQEQRQRLDELEQASKERSEQKSAASDELRRLRLLQGEHKRQIESLETETSRKKQQQSRDHSRLERIEGDIQAAEKSKAIAEHERGILRGRLQTIHQEQESLRTLRTVELSVASERSRKRNTLGEQVNEQDKLVLGFGQKRQFLDNTYASLETRLHELESDKQQQEQRRHQLEVGVRKAKTRILEIRGQQKLYQAEYESQDEKLGVLREQIKRLDEQNTKIHEEKELAYQERVRLELKMQQLREAIQKSRTVLESQFELNAASVLGHIERNGFVSIAADERLQDEQLPEEYQDYAQALRLTQAKLDNVGDQEARRAQLAELQKSLTALGDVNQTAVEMHQQLEEERKTLAQQHDDLAASARRIRETIEKLNVECITRFGETFEQVNAHFQEIYPRLVGGGRSDLELCEPNDLLNTGVEIYAQPPGKRLQSLKPLSGGEKAMVAISLLFALFRVKPSPFCLLDEVDAPLDEGNGMRFNAMLAEMAKKSQFIVITHNKKTMEVMDTLYGVSMPVQGISQIVSVELN